jgi:hypothetical protein
MKKLWVILLAPFSMAMMCGPGDDDFAAPESDVCRMPAATGEVTTVRILSAVTDEALVDGAELPITIGGQGADMIGIRLEVTGADVPACLAQETHVTAPMGEPVADFYGSLEMRETDVAGTRMSGTAWLFPNVGIPSEATLRTTVYGVTEEVRVTVVF